MHKTHAHPDETKTLHPGRTAHRTVAICGDSVLLLSVGASLGPNVRVEYVRPDAPVQEMLRRVREANAEAVVFELGRASPDWAFEVLRSGPELVLVGIGWESDQALVLSGRSAQASTGNDLLRVIGINPSMRDG